MNLRYNLSAAANLETFLTNFMSQNNISAYDMRGFLNNFMVKLDDAIQTELLIEIQEAEAQHQKEHEHEQQAEEVQTELIEND